MFCDTCMLRSRHRHQPFRASLVSSQGSCFVASDRESMHVGFELQSGLLMQLAKVVLAQARGKGQCLVTLEVEVLLPMAVLRLCMVATAFLW